MNRIYRVDEIRSNRYMGTEYIQIELTSRVIFLMSNNVDLKIGDIVEIDMKDNIYKDGVMILDKEKEKMERQANTRKWKKAIVEGDR